MSGGSGTLTKMVILARTYRDNIKFVLGQASKDDHLVTCLENELKKEEIPYRMEMLTQCIPRYYNPYFYKGTPFYAEEKI